MHIMFQAAGSRYVADTMFAAKMHILGARRQRSAEFPGFGPCAQTTLLASEPRGITVGLDETRRVGVAEPRHSSREPRLGLLPE
jgi:hypothetical protein